MATANSNVDSLLREHDVARITGMSVATVRRWRLLNQGPPYLKLGASIRYPPEALEAWLKARPMGGEIERNKESGC